jgi:hypothetical protein
LSKLVDSMGIVLKSSVFSACSCFSCESMRSHRSFQTFTFKEQTKVVGGTWRMTNMSLSTCISVICEVLTMLNRAPQFAKILLLANDGSEIRLAPPVYL